MSSRRAALPALALALTLAACDGNINDENVRVAVTSRASLDFLGGEAIADCQAPSISADGRFVAFQTFSPLSPLDTTTVFGLPTLDVYVRDVVLNTTTLVSLNSAGTAGGFGWSFEPQISPDGRYVAFWSGAADLDLAGVDTNGLNDVFIRDLQTGVTTLVSVATSGFSANAASLSAQVTSDGANVYVAWNSQATNLVALPAELTADDDVFLRRMAVADVAAGTVAGTTVLATPNAGFTDGGAALSAIVPGSRASALDATFVYLVVASAAQDIQTTGVTDSPRAGGGILDTDVFLVTFPLLFAAGSAPAVELVSIRDDGADSGNVLSSNPSISADARFVAFTSFATDLLPVNTDTNGAGDIFVRDISGGVAAGTTARVSVSSGGSEADAESDQADLSADGRYVIFKSTAANLVENDINASDDIFRHDRTTGTTIRVSVRTFGAQANGASDRSSVSADGQSVAFDSTASNLVGADTNAAADIFVRQY